MKTLQEQSEIVKERLHYHFAKIGGGWNIEGMNMPFMNEFLNEVERLCVLSDIPKQSNGCDHDYQPCKHEAVSDFDKCTKCGKIK